MLLWIVRGDDNVRISADTESIQPQTFPLKSQQQSYFYYDKNNSNNSKIVAVWDERKEEAQIMLHIIRLNWISKILETDSFTIVIYLAAKPVDNDNC